MEPVAWRFSFVLRVSPARAWVGLMDTSRMNRQMRLPPMRYDEREGTLHGDFRAQGIRWTWVEPPWTWSKERFGRCVRIYSRGPATKVVITLSLAPEDEGRASRIDVAFDWTPRHGLGRFLLDKARGDMQRRYAQALAAIEAHFATHETADGLLDMEAPPPSQGRSHRVREHGRGLVEAGVAEDVATSLVALVERGDPLEVARLRPRRLARRFGVDEGQLVVAMLHATRRGLLEMSWDVLCPHCRGVQKEVASLGELPERASCPTCQIEFGIEGDDAVEVVFRPHPSVREVPRTMYCSSEISAKVHVVAQQPVEAGVAETLPVRLEPGRYRLRRTGVLGYRPVDVVGSGAPSEVTIHASDFGALTIASDASLRFVNDGGKACVFTLEDARWIDEALRPAQLFSLQAFRDLFAREFLAEGVRLSVGEQVILFTDIVGSTRLYGEVGDAGAFAAVSRHFREVYEEVKKQGGAVVKTIGDAAMAAFVDPCAALETAIALQHRFHERRGDTPVRLRASLNVGPCIAVRLNSNIDYFGQTVNVAAKLQSLAGTGEVVFPVSLLGQPGVRELLRREGLAIEETAFELASAGLVLAAARVRCSSSAATARASRRPLPVVA